MKITPLNNLEHYLRKLIEAKLWVKVIVALILGLATGILLSPSTGLFSEEMSHSIGNWLALPGKLFLKLVQMVMIPLIVASIITGIVSNSKDQIQKMGGNLLVYFLLTTTCSITLGVLLSFWLKPGNSIYQQKAFSTQALSESSSMSSTGKVHGLDTIPDAISELFPENPLASMVSGEMLSIVIFTIIIGIAVTRLSPQTLRPVLKIFLALQEICMTIVSWAMLLVPYAVFGMMAQLLASIGWESIQGIGYFVWCVLIGLFILLLLYLMLVTLLGKMNPFQFLKKIRDVQLLAFSTASSAAVMPLSMKTADEKLGVSSKISDFIIPLGATINMDGTAIYQCMATLFIAQAYGMEIMLGNVVLIMITIVAASIGTPAIPGGGVIVLASVLQSAGIPADGIIIVIGVDRILGMFRTAINVTGDLTACIIFNRWYGGLAKI